MNKPLTCPDRLKILNNLFCGLKKIHKISDKVILDLGIFSCENYIWVYNKEKTNYIYLLYISVIDGVIWCKNINSDTFVNGDINYIINYLNSCYT